MMDINTIRENIIRIFIKNIDFLNESSFEKKLSELAINSVVFIKIIVELEDCFDFEFDDEDLDYNRFIYLNDICEYIGEKLLSIHE